MNELITIEEREGIQTVNARELWAGLEVGRDFSTWIKGRIEKYDFVEGQDFVTVILRPENNLEGGRPFIEYHVSLDAAKTICMSENNEKGRALVAWMARVAIVSVQEMLDAIIDIDVPMDDLFVYAIREEETGRVKIGISADPESRLRALQVGNSQKLTLERVIPAPHRFADEIAYHKQNIEHSVRGEWFAPVASL
jgi:phage anti-repressor protein